MELLDIYNSIKNPIDDPDIIHELINIYGDNSTIGYDFYNKIINQKKKGKKIVDKNNELYEIFEVGIFRKWRKELITLTKEQLNELIKEGVYPENITKLIDYLKNVPEVRSLDELNNIRYSHDVPSEIRDLFNKYYWESNNQTFQEISSSNIYAKKTKDLPVEHQLFLNLDSTAIHKIAIEFISKCESLGIPYHFLLSPTCVRDDNMVILSDTEHLPLYIEVINAVKEENPDLVSAFHEAPILSGKINEWLGYGTSDNYIQSRSDVVEKAIENTTKEWIKNNIIKMIFFRDQYVHFFEYITKAMVEAKLKDLRSTYKFYDDSSRLDKKGYDPDYAFKQLGLKDIDLNSKEYEDYLYNKLIKNMEDRIISYCESPYYPFKVETPTRDDSVKVTFDQFDLHKTLCRIASKINENDPEFETKVKDNIEAECKKAGIDKSKFCFDVEMVYKFIYDNGTTLKKDVPIKKVNREAVPRPVKTRVIKPMKVLKKRDMLVHTNYVPTRQLTEELQNLIDNDTDKVLPFIYENMNAVRILLPYLMEHHTRLANMFIDEVSLKYPEVQDIYNHTMEKKMTDELQHLIDNKTELVLPFMYKNIHVANILLPYLVDHHPRLASMFVDDVVVRHPEVQDIYNRALDNNVIKRGL